MSPEDFEALKPADKQKAIAEADAERIWFGYCAKCAEKIKAKLRNFPKQCKKCGYGPSSS